MSFPLLYCNGCSYSDEKYRPELQDSTYVNRIQEKLGHGFVLNNAKSGSNNTRIIRTSLHDLYQQREQNPTQQIIALIQLTFEIRDELWHEHSNLDNGAEESNFITHQFSENHNWKKLLLSSLDIGAYNGAIENAMEKKFLKKYSEGRAFFYSPYQERINLFSKLAMFHFFCKCNNIIYLIFQGPKAEGLENEYLLDFFKEIIPKENIMDLENFGFCSWCAENGYMPYDQLRYKEIGHYKKDAHYAFADRVLMPKLKEIGIK